MNISVERVRFQLSNKRMKRARRLYTYLVFEEAIKSSENLIYYTTKAKAFGLWSDKTGDRDACFHFAAYLCKHLAKANPSIYQSGTTRNGWYEFTEDFDHLFIQIRNKNYSPFRYRGQS